VGVGCVWESSEDEEGYTVYISVLPGSADGTVPVHMCTCSTYMWYIHCMYVTCDVNVFLFDVL
jgi:hypothetical protein